MFSQIYSLSIVWVALKIAPDVPTIAIFAFFNQIFRVVINLYYVLETFSPRIQSTVFVVEEVYGRNSVNTIQSIRNL